MVYYKTKVGKGFLVVKEKDESYDEDYVEISEDEYNKLKVAKKKTYTKAELKARENKEKVLELKNNLAKTDYLAIKYAEGELTDEEYAPYKEQRKQWRVEINELEK